MTAGGTIVLVGNRMLGIMALAGAAAAAAPVADRLGPGRFAVAALAAVLGLLALVRRVELEPEVVWWRTVARRRRCTRRALERVELDHRFLRFRPPGRPTVRIEVPAELRPEVRRWALGGEVTDPPSPS